MIKKKKFLKQILPLLIALKVKLSAFAVIAYIVIALIAKKALLASLISLLVSGFIGIKKLLASQHHAPHHEVVSTAFRRDLGDRLGYGRTGERGQNELAC